MTTFTPSFREYRSRPARLLWFAVSLAALALGASSNADHVRNGQRARVPFPPVDEAVRDIELSAVRGALIRAALAGDRAAFIELVADEFGGGEPARSATLSGLREEYFARTAALLASGGIFVKDDYFCAPYWHHSRLRSVTLPTHMVQELWPSAVLVPETPVFEGPDATTRVVARLGLELVDVVDYPVGGFAKIVVAPDVNGFVRLDAVSKQNSDEEACFAKRDGRWRLAEFLTP